MAPNGVPNGVPNGLYSAPQTVSGIFRNPLEVKVVFAQLKYAFHPFGPLLGPFWGLNKALNRGSFRGIWMPPSEVIMKGCLDVSTAVAHVDGMQRCFIPLVTAPKGSQKGSQKGPHLGAYLGTLFRVPKRPKWRFGALKWVLNR